MDEATIDTREEVGVSMTVEGTTLEGSAAPCTEDNAATCTEGDAALIAADDAAMNTHGGATTIAERHPVPSVPDSPAMDESSTVGANDESVDTTNNTVSPLDTVVLEGSRGAVVEGSTPGASAAATTNGEATNEAAQGDTTATIADSSTVHVRTPATAIVQTAGARAKGGGTASIPEGLTIDATPAATTNGAATDAQSQGVDEAVLIHTQRFLLREMVDQFAKRLIPSRTD
jgi:hypothetical protein